MAVSYKAELVGVFGYPVAENPTCVMQEAAFNQLGLQWRYLTIEVKPDALADAMRGMRAMAFQGINLTIPHKVAVMQYLDEIAEDAAKIGAVNTVRRLGDKLIGENTDGKGFLRGVREEASIDPQGKKIVIMGAGGAARAIAVELALARAAEIIVYNRSNERGEAMVKDLVSRTGAKASFKPWMTTYAITDDVDILVNATSIGLYPDVDAVVDVNLEGAQPGLLVCDVIPNPPETRLMKAAQAQGLKTLNGLSMLVFQGVIGFEMWTGEKAPEQVMKDALRQAFGV